MSAAKITARFQSTLHNYKLLASIDVRLTESLIDRDGVRIHKAIAAENVIDFSDHGSLYRFLEESYTTSFQSLDYRSSINEFVSDSDRGFCGFSVIANKNIKKGVVVSGLVGVVGNLSEAFDFEFDFATFVCQ